MWLLLRKNRSEEGLGALKINRAYTILVLVVLPFIAGTFSFFSVDVATIGMSFLLLLVFLSLFVVLFKFNKKNSEERMKDLKDLLKESTKHPIRYEFARKIVAPEIKKLRQLEDKLTKEKKEFKSKRLKEEAGLKVKESKIDDKLKKDENVKAYVLKNLKTSEINLKKSKEELNNVELMRKELEKKESLVDSRLDTLDSKIENYKKKGKDMTLLFKKHKLDLSKKTKEILEGVKEGAMKDLQEKERELELSRTELNTIRKEVARREKNLNPRINLIEKREKEVESRFSKLRRQEADVNESVDNLEILKKKVTKDVRALKNSRNNFEDEKLSLDRKDKSLDRLKAKYDKRNTLLNEREESLNDFEKKLKDRQSNLNNLEKSIARKNREVSTLQVKLNKDLKERSKGEGDIGEIISEKKYKKNGRAKK